MRADREIPFRGGVSPRALAGMAEFVRKRYLEANLDALAGRAYTESWTRDGRSVVMEWSFSPADAAGSGFEPLSGRRVRLSLDLDSASIAFPGLEAEDAPGASACAHVADDIEVMITMCLAKGKTTSLYFILSPGGRGAVRDAPAPPGAGRDALKRLLSGNTMNLYLLIMALSFGLFFVVGEAAIFAVLALQLLVLVYSDRLALRVGKVRPTASRPWVTVVSVPVGLEEMAETARIAKENASTITEKLETRLSGGSAGGAEAAAAVQSVLAGSGISSSSQEIRVVTRDVYGLVKGVADRFRLPAPRIAVVNSVADNAAATGVSPSRSSITITAGSIQDLGDGELSSVIGHELGHIKGRDSLILFSATSILYAGGLYLWLPVLLYLGVLYYVVIFAAVYSVGKVLETRADTESAATLGEPGVLASALSTIGFRQLYVERYSRGARVWDWLSFDPHPPVYFRVKRLTRLAASREPVGNTLLLSIKDCAAGFLEALL